MTDTWSKDRRWDDMSLVQIYNGVKSMLDFDVAEGGTGKR